MVVSYHMFPLYRLYVVAHALEAADRRTNCADLGGVFHKASRNVEAIQMLAADCSVSAEYRSSLFGVVVRPVLLLKGVGQEEVRQNEIVELAVSHIYLVAHILTCMVA